MTIDGQHAAHASAGRLPEPLQLQGAHLAWLGGTGTTRTRPRSERAQLPVRHTSLHDQDAHEYKPNCV